MLQSGAAVFDARPVLRGCKAPTFCAHGEWWRTRRTTRVTGTCPWRRSRSTIEPGAFLVEVHEAMSSRKFLLPLTGLLVIGLAIASWTARPALASPGQVVVTQINAATYTVVATYTDDTPAGSAS